MISLFVDDFIGGGGDGDDVYNKFTKLVGILKEASFCIHKFISNDENVTKKVQLLDDDYVCNKTSFEKNVHDVLGLSWDYTNDKLLVKLGEIVDQVSDVTKRDVLRIIAKIYDPLGLCGPVTIKGKMIFQEFCRRNITWDEKSPDDLLEQWLRWIADLKSAQTFTIPRCYESRKVIKSSLIGFCDGSTKAYDATVYLRNELECGEITSLLVGCKARVAPLGKAGTKLFTVPRLELLGCVILSQFMKTVEKSFAATGSKISEKRFYTDSTINLCRIRGKDKEFQQWVQNRVSGIRSKSEIDDWCYVPTKLNASDLPSRGCSLKDLQSCDMWMYGPEFIREKKIKIFDYNKSSVVEPGI